MKTWFLFSFLWDVVGFAYCAGFSSGWQGHRAEMAAVPPPYTTVPNHEHYLSGTSEDDQLHVVRSFWERDDGFREEWSIVHTTRVVKGEVDEGSYDQVGLAAQIGLAALITSRNLLPYGAGCVQARLVIHCFDSQPSGSNDVLNTTWLHQKQMVIRYYYQVYNRMPSPEVANADIIGSGTGNRVMEHYQTIKNQLVALLIVKCAYGWHFSVPSRKNVNLKALSKWP